MLAPINKFFEVQVASKWDDKIIHTAQKMKFFIKDFFSKCDQSAGSSVYLSFVKVSLFVISASTVKVSIFKWTKFAVRK